MWPFLLIYLKILLEEGLEICTRKRDFCFWFECPHSLDMAPDEGQDIWYELESLSHGLETWYKNYLYLFLYISKIVSIKKKEVKKTKDSVYLCHEKKIWTVKINWLMLYDRVDIVGRNYCMVRIFFLGCVS